MKILFVDDAGVQRTFEPDATTRIQHELASEVTKRPVAKGTDLTDNVRALPVLVVAEFQCTNTPIEGGTFSPLRLSNTRREITKTAKVEGGPGTKIQFSVIEIEIGKREVKITPAEETQYQETMSPSVMQFATEFDRVRDTLDMFRRLKDKPTLMTVVTRFAEYDNCVVSRISLPEEPMDAGSFTVEVQQIRVGTVGQVEVVPVGEKRAESKTAQGAQSGYELPEEQQSTLTALRGAI